jgi:hypothetical protein
MNLLHAAKEVSDMGVCVFDAKTIGELARHAVGSSDWSMGYETDIKPAPGLLFVHDSGVYCMSNGIPSWMVRGGECNRVAYAEGCEPKPDIPFDDWYYKSRDLVGGDDFAEVLPVDDQFLERCDSNDEFCVDVTHDSITTYFRRKAT